MVKEVEGKTGYLQNLLVSENVCVCTNRKICALFFLMSVEPDRYRILRPILVPISGDSNIG